MNAPLFLCLLIPEFAAQALLRVRPALRDTPVAVLEGTAPLETVAAVNRAARRLGVIRHMRKSELSSFPTLTVLRRSELEERTARAAAFDIVSTLTPRLEDRSSDTDPGALVLVLDITGSDRLFGTPSTIARVLLQGLRSMALEARCSISSNFSAAVCVARAATRRVTIVPDMHTADTLAPLPLSSLPLTPEQAETLSLWGLRTVGELAALPPLDLVTRLGSSGERLHQLARGVAPHLMVPAESPLSLEEAVEFDSPVDTVDSLLFVLGSMLDGLIARARAHALELSAVTAHMQLEGGGTHTRTLKPAVPVADRALLLKLLQLDLAAHPPAAGVLTLRVTAEPGARSKVQTGLFTPQTPEPVRLEVTLARIAALVGEGRVGRPKLSDSHAPESFTIEHFTIPEPATSRTRRSKQPRREDKARRMVPKRNRPAAHTHSADAHTLSLSAHTAHPSAQSTSPSRFVSPEQDADPQQCGIALRRFRPPVPISPRSEAGVLLVFHFQGTRYEVRERFGPWRRSGHWWSGEIWSHEEWDIAAETTSPADRSRLLCLISHDLLHDRWHMEAVYD